MRALLWKELREQFGRWLPATILMTGVFFLLVRARLVSIRETVILIDVIGGCILSVLLIVETFPIERTRGTLNFIRALPVPPRRLWFAKWFAAGLSIFAMLGIATLAGLITAMFVDVDLGWLALATLSVCVSMLAFQTAALPVLMYAKNEMDAALGAVSIAVLTGIWGSAINSEEPLVRWIAEFSPLTPMLAFFINGEWHIPFHIPDGITEDIMPFKRAILSVTFTSLIWIAIPGACMLLGRQDKVNR